jgi:hypothetical protein
MQMAFELLDMTSSFLVLFGAVAFSIVNSPKSVAFHKERTKELAEPGVRLKLDGRVYSVHVILL